MTPDVGLAILTGLAIIGTIFLAFWQNAAQRKQNAAQRKQEEVNYKLQMEINRLSAELDQSIKRLYRASDLVNTIHRTSLQNIVDPENRKHWVLLSSSLAELRGLAFAIDDKELLGIVNEAPSWIGSGEVPGLNQVEAYYRIHSQQLHTRISELLISTMRERREVEHDQ